MKKNIHPQYYRTTVTCACGESFETGSTSQNLRVEICSTQKFCEVEIGRAHV